MRLVPGGATITTIDVVGDSAVWSAALKDIRAIVSGAAFHPESLACSVLRQGSIVIWADEAGLDRCCAACLAGGRCDSRRGR